MTDGEPMAGTTTGGTTTGGTTMGSASTGSAPIGAATPQEACRLTVYYDGACPLCRAEIAHYRGQSGAERIAFQDVADPASAAPGADLAREAALARFHVRDADGRLLSGAAAFARLWDELPAWKRAARIARAPVIAPLLELGYRAFLPVRPVLSRAFGAWQRRRTRAA